MSKNYYTEIVADQNTVELLDGVAFRWFDYGTVDYSPNPNTKEYLVYIPDNVNVFFYGRSFSSRSADMSLEVYVNPTFSSEGLSMTSRVFNRNSDSPKTTDVQIWQDPVIVSDGSLVDYDETAGSVGGGTKGSLGSITLQEFPRFMPRDVYFLVRITNLSQDNVEAQYVYKLFWSELVGDN